MNYDSNKNNILIFHPGEYLWDYLKESKIPISKFAKKAKLDEKTIFALINEEIPVTQTIAKHLSLAIGTSSDFWINLQKIYDKDLKTIQNFQRQN